MRTVLDLSSHVEAGQGPNSFLSKSGGTRELPSHASPAIDPTVPPHAVGRAQLRANRDPVRTGGVREDPTEPYRNAKAEEDFFQSMEPDFDGGEEHFARTPRKPGIVIIHSRTVFRDCLAQCLELAYSDHHVTSHSSIPEWLDSGESSRIDTAVVIVVAGSAESIIADLELLETNAVTIPAVIVSDTDDINHIVRALKCGARGYIPTSLSLNVAVEALRLVKAGGVFIPASSLVPDGDDLPQASNSTILTKRQMEIVEEIRHGKANKQIAYDLRMSEHTVKVHLRHIMRKLKARNRTEVAVRSGNLLPGHKDP